MNLESTVSVPARGFIATGIVIKDGGTITVSVDSTQRWAWGGGGDTSDADGTKGRPNADEHPVFVEGALFGQLCGRVGNFQFALGAQASVKIVDGGELCLFMNDRVGHTDDNRGAINVAVVAS